MTQRCSRLRAVLLVLAVGIVSVGGWAAAEDPPAATPRPGGELTRLAEAGRFDDLLASLKALAPASGETDVSDLTAQIERFQAQRAAQAQTRREGHAKAMAAMTRRAAAGRLEQAVLSAIEAHGLADDPEALLQSAPIKALVGQAEAAIQAAKDRGDWVEAVALYAVLDLLFEDYATYRLTLTQASRHVEVLRLYLPERLEELLRARAEHITAEQNRDAEETRHAAGADTPAALNEADDPDAAIRRVHVDKDPWPKKLAGVEFPMLLETLKSAAQRHVSSRGYTQLFQGALNGLSTLVDTRGIGDVFPKVGDDEQLTAFRARLAELRERVNAASDELNASDAGKRDRCAADFIERIAAANAATVALPPTVLAYEMVEGALSTLDEFSSVIWPRDREAFARNFQGKFFGVGIQIQQKPVPKMVGEQLVVVTPLEDTPAQRAGIRADDVIVTVNGKPTSDWTLDQAVREITDTKEGTTVVLGIYRPGQRDVMNFELVRAKIPIETVRGWEHKPGGGWDYFIDRGQKIGYVRLNQFIPQTAGDLDAAIHQMEREGGVRALVLDLRFNPGGLLTSARDVANRFIHAGTIVSTVGPPDTKPSVFVARPDRAYPDFPVAVLINRGSASASEIVSGALQDYGRAIIVGTRSYGKGSVQDVFEIDDGKAFLKLTTQYYKLPKNRIIHRRPDSKTWGIEPDLKVAMTTQEIKDWLEFRQDVDILRSRDAVAPDPPGEPRTAAQILERNLDPQLTSAILVLKTDLLADHLSLAKKEPAAPAAATP